MRCGQFAPCARPKNRNTVAIARRRTFCHVTRSPAFIGEFPPEAEATVQAIREAVAHSTCAPYAELAGEDTLIINPAWADEPRTTGISHATCGVISSSKYTNEHVRPLAAAYETDGSVFLLWERLANYAAAPGAGEDAPDRTEDICGITYVKKRPDGKASVIATFRQPTPHPAFRLGAIPPNQGCQRAQVELQQRFRKDREVAPCYGPDNFFDGQRTAVAENPVAESQMLAAVRTFYSVWRGHKGPNTEGWDQGATATAIESALLSIADPKLRVKDPVWGTRNSYLPLNRVEAGMWLESSVRKSDGHTRFDIKALAHSEGTNLVFALWFAHGLGGREDGEVAGAHVFSFGNDLKISSVTAFREPDASERKLNLL